MDQDAVAAAKRRAEQADQRRQAHLQTRIDRAIQTRPKITKPPENHNGNQPTTTTTNNNNNNTTINNNNNDDKGQVKITDFETAIAELRNCFKQLVWPPLKVSSDPAIRNGQSLEHHTPFEKWTESTNVDITSLVLTLATSHKLTNRAMGVMVGMAVGDAVGAPLEFISVTLQGASNFHFHTNTYTEPYNKFHLDAGQWTDDSAMGLCLADSFLSSHVQGHTTMDGSDVRLRFWSWWFRGLNNAFRKDSRRNGSVGLGGNISQSLYSMIPNETPSPRYEVVGEDSGNGSLMRLAAVPIYHNDNITTARAVAAESSYTTHPGPLAAEACRFVCHIVVRGMHTFDVATETPQAFIDRAVEEYLPLLDDPNHRETASSADTIRRLLRSKESDTSLERNWNWRNSDLDIVGTLVRRGNSYNGYPVSPGYFGAYSLDAVAIALNSIYHTDNFNNAIVRSVNFLGDADSTAAITGQIAGAMYGWTTIDDRFKSQLHKWDDGQFALRAAMLVHANDLGDGTKRAAELTGNVTAVAGQ